MPEVKSSGTTKKPKLNLENVGVPLKLYSFYIVFMKWKIKN